MFQEIKVLGFLLDIFPISLYKLVLWNLIFQKILLLINYREYTCWFDPNLAVNKYERESYKKEMKSGFSQKVFPEG